MSEVQTEGTNLAVVTESTFNAFTPPTTGWRNLQPNSYGNFGPTYKKLPRDPISKNLQLRKGMLVDMDSMLPFETDITKDVIDRFAPGIYRSVAKHSGGTGLSTWPVTSVTATGYTVASLGNVAQNTIVFARGFATAANNGLKLVGASSSGTEIKVAGLVAEASPPSNAEVGVAGFRFTSGDLSLNSAGNLVTATKDLTTLGLNVEQFIYVGGRQDDAAMSFADLNYQGAAKIVSIAANLITLERRTWLVESSAVLDLGPACANIDTVVEAIERGADGNAITVTIVADAVAAAGTISEVGSAVTFHVKTSVTATTVAQFEALVAQSTLIRVKTPDVTGATALAAGDVIAATPLTGGTTGADAGTGKTVEVYFSRWYRNVPMDHADFRRPSFAFEVTYPDLDGGVPEYEYMLGNMLDECVWNFPLTGKSTVNLSFVGCRTLNPTATRNAGPSAAIDANSNEGVSTSTDLQRIRIAGVDEAGITTDFQSLKITDKNNVTAQKQLGKLGARLLNQGKHTAMVEADVIFTDSEVIKAVRDNRDACLDILMRNEDFGALLDVQAMTLDSTERKMEREKIMSIGTKATGHQDALSTDSLSVFEYLPELPEEDQ